jgi:hypothetical protein
MLEADDAELRDERTADAFGKPGDFLYAIIGGLLVMIAVAAAGQPSYALGQSQAEHRSFHAVTCNSAKAVSACTGVLPMAD